MCKEIKCYTENNIKYRFDSDKLNRFITQKRTELTTREKRIFKTSVMRELSEVSCVSFDAVKNWTYGVNGPVDLEQVKTLSEYFGVDYHELLKQEENKVKIDEIDKNYQLSESQKIQTHACVREIYVAIYDSIDKVWDYYHAEDANLMEGLSDEEIEKQNITTYEKAEESCVNVIHMINRYLLDIPFSLREKVTNWYWCNVRSTLMNIVCRFSMPMNADDPEEMREREESAEELRNQEMHYKEGYYFLDLSKLFSEYIMP